MIDKLVSIVLPTFNGCRYIKETIESIVNQTYKNWELIIVNDCSTDNTLEIISECASKDCRIKIFSNSINQKVAVSLNNGFREARGAYYTWISDDNKFKPDALEYMVNFLNKNKKIDFVSCAYEIMNENGDFTSFSYDYYSKKRKITELFYENNIGACFLYRKRLAENVGNYDFCFPLANDYDYWMRAAAAGCIAYDNAVLYEYRDHPNNLTTLKKEDMIRETVDIIRKNAYPLALSLKMDKTRKINMLVDLYDDTKNELYMEIANKISPFDVKIAKFKNRLIQKTIGFKKYEKRIIIYIFGIKISLKRKRK